MGVEYSIGPEQTKHVRGAGVLDRVRVARGDIDDLYLLVVNRVFKDSVGVYSPEADNARPLNDAAIVGRSKECGRTFVADSVIAKKWS